MKKFYLSLIVLTIFAALFRFGLPASAQVDQKRIETPSVSPNVVISQIYGGGGVAGAQYTNDFVELFNRGSAVVNLNAWSVQYASATGSNWLPASPLPNFNLQPGQYFLVQFDSSGAVGSPLPAPDFVATVLQPEGFIPNLSSSTGKVALVNVSTRLPASTCPSDTSIVDFLGYGSTASCFEGGGKAPNLTATTSLTRNNNGCNDTDNNNLDFTVGSPSPRNSASAINTCSGGGTLSGSGFASPSSVAPGNLTLLTVNVNPVTAPPSTGITVNADLTSIGGSATQQLFDDGTNGDATAGDNIFSFFTTIPANAAGGNRSLTLSIADAQTHTATTTINLTVTAPADPAEHLAMGNPSGATTDVNNPLNYLLVKTQYVESYNRDNGRPNWVSWHLDSSWLGSVSRSNDFRPDSSLPAGWYQVLDNDYSGSGFDRGHHCPSGDRTNTAADNSATFFMTNMMPQSPDNNQGPWEVLESYCRTLVSQGNELYIVAGGTGIGGTGSNGGVTMTVANGHVTVPSKTWKVIIVLPTGSNDVDRVTKGTRVIAVIMPNVQGIKTVDWHTYRVSVRSVEALTGYTFFTNVRPMVRGLIKQRIDTLP